MCALSVVRAPAEGRTIVLGDAGVVTIKTEGCETANSMTAYEFVLPPTTAGPPLHVHRGWDELFYVLDGEITFLVDGQQRSAPARTCVFVPRGVQHTFWNAGDVPAKQLTVFTPSGIEGHFEDLTKVLSAGDNQARAAMQAMEQNDMVISQDARPAYEPINN